MAVWQLLQAELLVSSRNMRERWAEGKMQVLWFLFLFFGLVYASRLVVLLGLEGGVDLGIRPEDLLLLAMFTFFVKGAADSLHGLIENRYTLFLLAQPVRPGALLAARGIASTTMHLFFVTIGFFVFLAIDAAAAVPVRGEVPWLGYLELLAVAVFGTLCGVGMSVETHRKPLRRRITALLYSTPFTIGVVLLTQTAMGWAHLAVLAALSVATLMLLRLRGPILPEVIGVQERERVSSAVPRFPGWFAVRASRLWKALLQFEWIKYWRSRHHWIALLTVAILGFIGYYFRESVLPLVRELGFLTGSRFGPYVEVVFLFFLSYLAAMLLGAVPAMESLLGEQRTLYLFRSSPARMRLLTLAKGWHLAPNLALAALAVPLPIGLYLGLTPARILFSLGAAAGLFGLSLALALCLGALFIRTTSEEEEAGVVPLYSLLMTCLLLGGFAVAATGSVFLAFGHPAGWLALGGFVASSLLSLAGAATWSAKRLDRFEPRGAV